MTTLILKWKLNDGKLFGRGMTCVIDEAALDKFLKLIRADIIRHLAVDVEGRLEGEGESRGR